MMQGTKGELCAAGAFGAAAGTTGTKINVAIQFKTIHLKINFDRLCFLEELCIDDKLSLIHI